MERDQGKIMREGWKKGNNKLSATYFAYCVHNDNYQLINVWQHWLVCITRNLWAENGIDREQGATFVQTNVWTHMLCHFVFVCNWDWLSVWARQFEFLVTKIDCVQLVRVCWCMSSTLCLIKPISHRHSILEVSYSLTPLDAARVKLNTLFILSPPLPLSFLVTLPLSNTYSTPSVCFKVFVFFPKA